VTTSPAVSPQAEALATELARVRWRGIDDLDLATHQQTRVQVPVLEALAAVHTQGAKLGRIERIRLLVVDGLDAYEAAGFKGHAQFTRSLFIDEDTGATPGRRRPGDLLDAARDKTGLDDKAFGTRQRAVFRHFAGFLLEFVPEPAPGPGLGAVTPARRPLNRLVSPPRGRWLAAVGFMTLIAIAVGLTISRSGTRTTGAGTSPSRSTSAASRPTPPASASTASSTPAGSSDFRMAFDDLGGDSAIIRVFPGTTDTSQDRIANGTFSSGDVVAVKCRTTGRTVTSDPAVGERARQSDVWLEIVGTPGSLQFAPLTYAAISATTLAALPGCTGRG
jgi:hypothetical protein